MKRIALAMAATTLALASAWAAQPQPQVQAHWQHLGHEVDADGRAQYRHRFTLTGDVNSIARLGYNQFDRKTSMVDPADTLIRIIPGYYCIASPRFAQAKDTLIIDMVTRGRCHKTSFRPDGVHGVDAQGNTFPITLTRGILTENPNQWIVGTMNDMPDPEKIYALNEQLDKDAEIGYFDLVPTFKNARLTNKGVYSGPIEGKSKIIKHANPEFYRITVTPKNIQVEGASEGAIAMAWRAAKRLAAAHGGTIEACVIEDYPDYPYRGLMLDVARNFQTINHMKKMIDMMADYRLNRLQFHLTDDEAWRLEIKGLPELTQVGARRGYTLDEQDYMAQLFAGDGNPNTMGTSANGYYTQDEFIDFIKYAYDRGVQVIPEFETPGHARAAIKAMDARARLTGDEKWRLREPSDTSRFSSAQRFSDNVMNPALPGSYLMTDIVMDELIDMYRRAGVPLEIIHIGGDEVPSGAWSHSEAVAKLMKEQNLADEHAVHAYWMQEIAKMAKEKGVKIAGWQEVVLGKPEDVALAMAPQMGFINLWQPGSKHSIADKTTRSRQLGIPALICTSDNFYLDFCYDGHPDEPGLIWGGNWVDEFVTLDGYPKVLAPDADTDRAPIIGVQGQLWAECMRSPYTMEYALLPKMFGLAERGWNGDQTLTHPKYNTVIYSRELPWLDSKDLSWRLREPGIFVTDECTVMMNSPYPDAVIRYTTDGTAPNENSEVYTEPFPLTEEIDEIQAALFFRDRSSVPAIFLRQ